MYKRIKKLFETQRGGQRGMGQPDNGNRGRSTDAQHPIDKPVVKPKPETAEYKPVGGKGKTPPDQRVGQTMRSSSDLDLIKKVIKKRKEEADARKKAEKDKLNRRKTRNRGGSL